MSKNNGLSNVKQSEQARMQQLRKWREKKLHETTLPSGLDVVLRDVDLSDVVLDGSISNTLIDLITSQEFQQLSDEEAAKKIMSSDSQSFAVFLQKIVERGMVEPAIGEKADDTHILYSELTLEDKLHVFNVLSRDAQAVRSFRDE